MHVPLMKMELDYIMSLFAGSRVGPAKKDNETEQERREREESENINAWNDYSFKKTMSGNWTKWTERTKEEKAE